MEAKMFPDLRPEDFPTSRYASRLRASEADSSNRSRGVPSVTQLAAGTLSGAGRACWELGENEGFDILFDCSRSPRQHRSLQIQHGEFRRNTPTDRHSARSNSTCHVQML